MATLLNLPLPRFSDFSSTFTAPICCMRGLLLTCSRCINPGHPTIPSKAGRLIMHSLCAMSRLPACCALHDHDILLQIMLLPVVLAQGRGSFIWLRP